MNSPDTGGRTNGARGSAGRLPQAVSRGDRRLLAYRVVRRLMSACYWQDGSPLTFSGLYSADVSQLRRTTGGRPRYVVRTAEYSDLPNLSAYFGPERSVDARLSRGDVCVLAVRSGQIGAAVWLAIGPAEYREDIPDLGCSLSVPSHVAFSYDGKGTRLGAWGTLMMQLPGLLDDRRVGQVVTLVDVENTHSIRSHLSLGYRRIGYVGCVKFAGWVQTIYTVGGGTWRMLPGRIGSVAISRPVP